ncbi:hypothetical protein D3C80_1690470 [compost metagenome]
MAYRRAEVRSQRLREAVTIILTGKHRLHRSTEQRHAQPCGKRALHLLVVAVLRHSTNRRAPLHAQCGQPLIIKYHDGGLRKAHAQPAFAALCAVAGKARLRPADHQQLRAACRGEFDQALVAEVQRAELADHQAPRSVLRQQHRPPWPHPASGAASDAMPPVR